MDTASNASPQMNLAFDLAMLPGMIRAMRLMPAVALASSTSAGYRDAFRNMQQQLLLQSPLAHLDVVNDSTWFDMVTALSTAKLISIYRKSIRHSDKLETAVAIDSVEYIVASELAKGHPAHDEIEVTIRALAPPEARWKKRTAAAHGE